MIEKSAAVIIRDRAVLYVREVGFPYLILPGGCLKVGETAETALARELREELRTSSRITCSLGTVCGKGLSHDVPPSEQEVILHLFLVDPLEQLQPANEIVEMRYVTYCTIREYPMTPIGIDTINKLHFDGLID
jgi:ADP-ribose pyrophosphatase YjhB (NUDIX family)